MNEQTMGVFPEPLLILRGHREYAGSRRSRVRRDARIPVFLHNQACVHPPGPEGVDQRAPRSPGRRYPFGQPTLQVKRRLPEFDVGVHLVRINGRRQMLMLHLQDDLRKAGHSRRRLRLPDMGFDRTDRTESRFRRLFSKGLGQRRNFDAVTQLCARAMPFDITDNFRMNPRLLEGAADQIRLGVRIRRGITVRPPTVVERAAWDDGVNMILIGDRFAQRFQYYRSYALSGNEPAGAGAIAVTLSVERKHVSPAERLVF